MASKKSDKKAKNKKGSGTETAVKFSIIVVAALIIIVLIMIVKMLQDNGKKVDVTPTPTTAPTAEPAKPTTAVTEPKNTPTPVPTEPAKVTPTGAVAERDVLEAEAEKKVKSVIDTSVFTAKLITPELNVDGVIYFQYLIIDNNSRTYSPFLVVDRSGKVFCYNDGRITDFVKFPLDDTTQVVPEVTPGAVERKITESEAYDILCRCDYKTLGLKRKITEYDHFVEQTMTNIGGKNCFCISLSETEDGKNRNRGEFYISEDGQDCYMMNYETGEFTPVPIG